VVPPVASTATPLIVSAVDLTRTFGEGDAAVDALRVSQFGPPVSNPDAEKDGELLTRA